LDDIRAELTKLAVKELLHSLALVRAITNAVRDPRDIDIEKKVDTAQPNSSRVDDPFGTPAIVMP
jgi:hypothetical protein